MTEQAAAAGFTATETFPHALAFDRWWRATLPALLMVFVFVTLLSGCVLGAVGAPAGWVLAVVVAVGACVAWYLLQRARFVALRVLELSATGVVATGPGLRVTLPWSGLRRIGPAGPWSTDERITGAGWPTVGAGAPWYVRWFARADAHVCLTHFDLDWRRGRIGDWVRGYRPDLLQPTPHRWPPPHR